MKKNCVMALLSIGAISASLLSGCSGGNDSDSAAAKQNGLTELTFVMANRDEFMSAIETAMVAEAEPLGYKVVSQDAQYDLSKQIQYIETAVNGGAEAVICLPVNAEGTQSLIDAVGDKNLIFVNQPPGDYSELNAENVVYIGSDENLSGYYQGEWLANYFKEHGKKEAKYLMLQGPLGYASITKRTEGVLKAMKDNGVTPIPASAPLVAECDRPTAQEMIQPLLVAGTKFDCIIANNDAMALGAIEACKEAGVTIDFPIVGIDCTADGAKAIESGDLAMTVFQNAAGQGKAAIIAADNMIHGKSLDSGMGDLGALDDSGETYSDSIFWIPFEPVTKDNVADYL